MAEKNWVTATPLCFKLMQLLRQIVLDTHLTDGVGLAFQPAPEYARHFNPLRSELNTQGSGNWPVYSMAARLHFLASYRLIFINNRLFTDPRTGKMGVLYLAVSPRLRNSESYGGTWGGCIDFSEKSELSSRSSFGFIHGACAE